MPDSLVSQYRRWFDYEQDAHAKAIQSLESVPLNRRSAPEFARAVGLLAHIVAARRVWLGRLGAAPPASGSLFPQNMELAQVIAQWNDVARLWTDFLGHLTDEAIARSFEYQVWTPGDFAIVSKTFSPNFSAIPGITEVRLPCWCAPREECRRSRTSSTGAGSRFEIKRFSMNQ
jgi:hypothetical protein